tara:strand:+ start:2440 stop:2652 length:213 start_codon:yes stop_codon:yes gene_type:complete
MEEMIKLTNGKKTIIRSKIQYEANIKNFEMRGFKLEEDKVKENIKEVDQTFENETKVVQLKPKKKKAKKK